MVAPPRQRVENTRTIDIERFIPRSQIDSRYHQTPYYVAPRDVMDQAQAQGVPAGALLSSLDQMSDPHFIARDFLVPVQQQQVGQLTFEGPAFRGSAMTPPRIAQAPLLGEHTREIARALLGLGDDEIDRCVADGVFELPRQP